MATTRCSLKKPQFLKRVLPTREGFPVLWRFGNDERRSTWHLTPLRFSRMVSQSRTSVQKACKKADVRNSAANKLTPPRESARRQSARHETRHVRRHPLLRVPLREGARRARRRQGARRGRRAPRRAPRLRGPRRGQEEGYVAPIFLPSSIRSTARARGGARGVRAVPDGSLASTRSVGSRSASGRERPHPASSRTRLRSVP